MFKKFWGLITKPVRKLAKNPPRWAYKIEKRYRFVISVIISTTLMLFSTFFFFDWAWVFVPLFIIIVSLLVFYSILEGVEKLEWLMLFLMPVLFTVSFYLFYFLFPVRWLTRIPFAAVYATSLYALLLTSNIFNVGVEKNLQLYRAAFSVNYFFQSFVAFLIFNILFSLRQNFLVNGLGAGIITFPLALQFLWTIKLDLVLEKQVLANSAFIALLMFELAIILSFIPLRTSISALLLSACYYSFIGLTTAYMDNRLFKNTIREYLFVLGFVLVITFLTLNW